MRRHLIKLSQRPFLDCRLLQEAVEVDLLDLWRCHLLMMMDQLLLLVDLEL